MFPYHRPACLCFYDCSWLMIISYSFINRAEWKVGWFSHYKIVRYTDWCMNSRQSSSYRSNIFLGLYIAIFFGWVPPQWVSAEPFVSHLFGQGYFLCTQNKAPFIKVPFRMLFTSFRRLHSCPIYPMGDSLIRILLRSINVSRERTRFWFFGEIFWISFGEDSREILGTGTGDDGGVWFGKLKGDP